MHRAGYEALGLSYVYAPFAVESADLRAALDGMRALGIRGLGVSMPFKIEVLPLLDSIDPQALRIGAVNTIVNDAGALRGHNTDATGAVRALEEIRELAGARCLVLGAGGAARAVVNGIADRGGHVSIANRDEAKARALAQSVGASVVDWASLTREARRFEIVVNATSVGMDVGGPTESPLDEQSIGPGQVVMDIVYKPIETALVKATRRAGATPVHGGRMLLHQAARQFELYTGRTAPLEAMDAALTASIG